LPTAKRGKMSFEAYILQEKYKKIHGLGDRLELMKQQIDWEPFVKIVKSAFDNDTEFGGRPNTDEKVVVRCMLLQAWYGLSDPELEFQCNDRISFQNFIGLDQKIPDFSTIWKIRDRLKIRGKERLIWNELQRQLDDKGYKVKKGVIQDASFIDADAGRKRIQNEKKAKKEGKEIQYSDKQKRHIDRDGTFTAKNNQVHYGYKNHTKVDVDNTLIRDYDVSTASLHDGEIDLVKEGDKAVYRDKAYFGKQLKAKNVEDKTMKRATKKRKLNGGEQLRNKAISRIRSQGERPYAVVKRVFHNDRTQVKTLERVIIKEMFKCFAYNLYQLVTLERKKLLAIEQ
jgi:IS5 family transposase